MLKIALSVVVTTYISSAIKKSGLSAMRFIPFPLFLLHPQTTFETQGSSAWLQILPG